MIGFYNYTVILTYIGLASGLMGIFSALCGTYSNLPLYFLILSGLLDMFDGTVAKTRKRSVHEKRFGIQIDSLSDLVCFGVLPVAIGYRLYMNAAYTDHKQIITVLFCIVTAIYLLCALIRLAYYNVLEEDRLMGLEVGPKKYVGMPVTTVAVILPFIYTVKKFLTISTFTYIYLASLFIIAMLFVMKFKIKKPGKLGMIILVLLGALEIVLLFLLYSPIAR